MIPMPESHLDPSKRHDFVLLFDVKDGNPNGDPDAGNQPRLDPETMHGLVTDVAIKRKVRDYVFTAKGGKKPYNIYVQHRGYLADHKKKAYEAVGAKKGSDDETEKDKARAWMCENYYDIRLFGGVLVGGKKDKKGEGGGYNCGQVRGPVQITFARSVQPVAALDISITRVALENSGEKKREDDDEKASTGTMGRKSIVPYGLYRTHGFFNPHFAEDTGVTGEDLALFWDALLKMWDQDHSSARGMMACQGLWVFTHDDPLGNAPAQALFSKVVVKPRHESPARTFADYEVSVEKTLPKGVTLTPLSWG